jgi:triacylglycerol lipase
MRKSYSLLSLPSLLSMLLLGACGPQLAEDAVDDSESADVHAAAAATRYPIILLHGFNASPTSHWGFYGVAASLRAAGYSVSEASVPPYNSVPVRARYLAAQVDQVLRASSAAKVNLVAHSMGGLDARYLISSLGYGNRVASLTTISTPHRGSYVADVGLKLSPGFADDALNAIARAWGETFSSVASDANMRAALLSLSEKNAPAFNAANPDDARVFYQSYAGVSSVLGIPNPKDDGACGGRWLTSGSADRMDALLVGGAAFVAHGTSLLPNDGMVMVSSARWGTFQGCVAADHLDEVGQIKDLGTDPRTGFNHLSLYRSIAAGLQARGL